MHRRQVTLNVNVRTKPRPPSRKNHFFFLARPVCLLGDSAKYAVIEEKSRILSGDTEQTTGTNQQTIRAAFFIVQTRDTTTNSWFSHGRILINRQTTNTQDAHEHSEKCNTKYHENNEARPYSSRTKTIDARETTDGEKMEPRVRADAARIRMRQETRKRPGRSSERRNVTCTYVIFWCSFVWIDVSHVQLGVPQKETRPEPIQQKPKQ